jgi:glycyl-tRNA synthetase
MSSFAKKANYRYNLLPYNRSTLPIKQGKDAGVFMALETVSLDSIVSLCKRRGFVYPSADTYGGLNGLYDFGHVGTLLKKNIKQAWTNALYKTGYEMLLFDGTILGPEVVWQASGHVKNFHDPMVDCLSCKHRYRADELDLTKACPHCGNKNWTEVRQFNMMFQTQVGALAQANSIAYLRPETAQTIFANFKNIYSTNRVKIPFGVAQIGKAFRNEITPKQFLFRVREFEQMEMEWFCQSSEAQFFFDFWRKTRYDFYIALGLKAENIRLRAHEKDELAHYSTQCSDVEYQFPFGWKELEGIADRGTYDLSQHAQFSGKDFKVHDEATKTSFFPHVVECSVGVGRLFLALLFDSYHEDTVDGETRTVLKLHPSLAPIKAAILPLTKKLSPTAIKIHQQLATHYGPAVEFDETGSIGKRYRRYDEIGTPVCFTYDFDSENDACVTARSRDTLAQERISIENIRKYLDDLT